MKKFLLFLISFVLVGTMMARQLTPDEALALAMGRMNASQSMRARTLATGANAARVNLVHTEATDEDVPLYYVYNISDGGFIIASADDRASSLLGYTDNGTFEGAMQNLSFMAWLEDCSQALQWISQMPEVEGKTPSAQTRALATSVAPLLGDIQWNQGAPYNNTTPLKSAKDSEGNTVTKHAPTGCVATAVAQVMMYYKWPDTGTGSHTNLKDESQTVDFSKSTYQWSKMLPTYKGNESQEAQNAVAKLMSDVGCALDMDYGYDESGASHLDIATALADYFKYDKGLIGKSRNMYTSQGWNDLLMTELDAQRPILFRATATSGGGHAFVLDGYDTNGLYHVNWGWGGLSNGYFNVNVMDPDNQGTGGYAGGYTIGQRIYVGVKPDKTGTSVAKPDLVVTKHFTIDREANQFSCRISNNGIGVFKGELGLVMESSAGKKTYVKRYDYSNNGIQYQYGSPFTIDFPQVNAAGYTIYPYYCDVLGGEMKRVAAPISCFSTLRSVLKNGKYTWDYDYANIADVSISDQKVEHNYVAFAPKLTFKVTNPASSKKEYVESAYVYITKFVDDEEKVVCSGMAPVFLKPGESKDVVVKCNNVTKEFKGNITPGEYNYSIEVSMGGYNYVLSSGTFNMIETPESNIGYDNFAINKRTFEVGEELEARVKVTNTGGYDEKNLAFAIFEIVGNQYVYVGETALKGVEINAGSSKTCSFNMKVTFGPGNFVGTFFEGNKQISSLVEITVVEPTALDEIKTEPDTTDGKSAVYDLQGRPVQQLQKGSLYIGNGKFVIK